jgi:ankyrin repeat protein
MDITTWFKLIKEGNLDAIKNALNSIDINIQNSVGVTALHIAADFNDLYLVKYLIEAGADLNVIDEFGWTTLHYAAKKRYLEFASILIEAGIDLNVQSITGQTALYKACYSGHLEMTRLLVEAGADLNIIDVYGNTHLYAASRYPYISKLLIEAGARLDQLTIKNCKATLTQQIVNNINKNEDWKWIKYLPVKMQRQFPAHLKEASKMGMYE